MTRPRGAMADCNVCGVSYPVGGYSDHRLLSAHLAVMKAKERSRTAKARRAYRKRIGYQRPVILDTERLARAMKAVLPWDDDLWILDTAQSIAAEYNRPTPPSKSVSGDSG